MTLIEALYVPNAPNLIAPEAFGGAGASTVQALRGLDLIGRARPDALAVLSPHWVSDGPFLVHRGARPRQLFDFTGFPPSLYAASYEPPGAPALAEAIVRTAKAAGVDAEATEEWGLDHGAWAPLLSLVPGARVPVVPISIRSTGPADHVRFGAALARALERAPERAVVVGTGSIAHRLDRFSTSAGGRWEEGERLEAEVVRLALEGRVDELERLDRRKWATLAPEGDLGPLFTVLGAVGGRFPGRLVSTDQVFGAAGLSVLEYAPAAAGAGR